MCCAPFVTQSLAADVIVRECEGRACRPVGLTAREEGTAPTGLAGLQTSGLSGSSLIGPHKCAIPCAKQKLGIDKRTEQRITRGTVEAPEPLRLRRRQSQSRHFDVFALNASQYVIKRLMCWHWWPPGPQFSVVDTLVFGRGHPQKSNGHATRSEPCRAFDASPEFLTKPRA